MITIGVLSDTHLSGPSQVFREKVKRCFADVDMVLHAGDLTHISVLEAFGNKEVHAVHGNMCGYQAQVDLPGKKIIEVNGFQIGLTHGTGYYHNIEERLYNAFGPLDCIVYGHTHKAVCHYYCRGKTGRKYSYCGAHRMKNLWMPWEGDHNFMTILAGVRTVPEHIERTHDLLLPDFQLLNK